MLRLENLEQKNKQATTTDDQALSLNQQLLCTPADTLLSLAAPDEIHQVSGTI